MTTPPDEQELAELLALPAHPRLRAVALNLAPELLTRLASLRAEVARLREALETYGEYDRRVTDLLSEAIHTAFRKGCQGGHAVWRAIDNLPPREWSSAINFIVNSLSYGIEGKLKAARSALASLTDPEKAEDRD